MGDNTEQCRMVRIILVLTKGVNHIKPVRHMCPSQGVIMMEIIYILAKVFCF